MMFDDQAMKIVEGARVHFDRLEGQGVLVPGNFILTAAHCIHWNSEGGMALGDFFIEEIVTRHGPLKVAPLAVEPVADIAVLGAPDDQTFPDDAAAFEQFCEGVTPVPVFRGTMENQKAIKAKLLANKRDRWIEGTACVYYGIGNEPPILWFDSDEEAEGGDSGGPIVSEAGELIGIISNGGASCRCAHPKLAIPAWVLRDISNAANS